MTHHRRPMIGLAAFGAALLAGCSTTPVLTIPASLPLPPKAETSQPGQIQLGDPDNRPKA